MAGLRAVQVPVAAPATVTYPPHRWILHGDPTQLAELRTHLNRVRGRTTRVHPRFADT
jgi:hypothetical protein